MSTRAVEYRIYLKGPWCLHKSKRQISWKKYLFWDKASIFYRLYQRPLSAVDAVTSREPGTLRGAKSAAATAEMTVTLLPMNPFNFRFKLSKIGKEFAKITQNFESCTNLVTDFVYICLVSKSWEKWRFLLNFNP